jgi:hypothetical protein
VALRDISWTNVKHPLIVSNALRLVLFVGTGD